VCRHGAGRTTPKRPARASESMRACRDFGFCRQVVSTEVRRTAVTAQYAVAAWCATFRAMNRHCASRTRPKLPARASASMRESRVFGFCRQVVSTEVRRTAVTAKYAVAAWCATFKAVCRHGASRTTPKRPARASASMRASRVFGFCRQVVSTEVRRTAVTAQYAVAAWCATFMLGCDSRRRFHLWLADG